MEGQVALITLILLTPILPLQSAPLLIYEVSPYPYSGTQIEYVCIVNTAPYSISLDGYHLTDFEGNVSLSGTIQPGEKFYIAQNSTAFFRVFGFYPQLTYSSPFALANHGDEVALMKGNTLMDLVIYGDSNYSSSGWIGEPVQVSQGHILRRYGYQDTDSSSDWSNYHTPGQSDFEERSFEASVELFTFPDNWREVLRFIEDARDEVLVEGYTMDSPEFMEALSNTVENGVEVKILLEGSPVGGMSEGEKFLVHTLWERGVNIRFMVNEPDEGVHNRYTFIHSKFIVVDSREVLVSTENFGRSSMEDTGNRGYGIIVRNRKFASYMRAIFLDDWKNVSDIREYRGEFGNSTYSWEEKLQFRPPRFNPVNLTARIEPVIAPDFSLNSFWNFVNSQRTLYLEALYVDSWVWKHIRNKTEIALVERADQEGMTEFRGRDCIRGLHAKLLIGDNSVLVGSMNFGNFSMTRNREISLILEGEKIRDFFLSVLLYDSSRDESGFLVVDREMYGSTLHLDFSRSENIERITVYMDGRTIYSGSPWDIEIELDSGVHDIKISGVDGEGKVWEISFTVEYHREYPWRGMVVALILAVFLYKLWKRK